MPTKSSGRDPRIVKFERCKSEERVAQPKEARRESFFLSSSVRARKGEGGEDRERGSGVTRALVVSSPLLF